MDFLVNSCPTVFREENNRLSDFILRDINCLIPDQGVLSYSLSSAKLLEYLEIRRSHDRATLAAQGNRDQSGPIRF
jgi:hypothetical protein